MELDVEYEEIIEIKEQLESNEMIGTIIYESKRGALEKFSQQIGERKDLISD